MVFLSPTNCGRVDMNCNLSYKSSKVKNFSFNAPLWEFVTECDEYMRIFEYSNIFDPNIYSDIRSYHFLDTNIFGYSFVARF